MISGMAIGVTLFSVGLFLRNPAYHDKAPEFMMNMQVIVFLIMIPFFLGLIFLQEIFHEVFGVVDVFYYMVAFVTLVNLLVGMIMLFIGKKHLEKLE